MAQELSISHNTILKEEPFQSSDPRAKKTVQVRAGETFSLETIIRERDGHVQVRLSQPGEGSTDWWAFIPHVNIKDGDKAHSPVPGKAHSGTLIHPDEWRLNSIARGIAHHYEGCRLTSYLCPAGVWTIGWGNTRLADGSPVTQGMRITQEEADKLADYILTQFVRNISQFVRVPLRGSAIGALTSFAYNVGVQAFKESTLLLRLNEGYAVEELQYQIRRWCKANGRVLPGLLVRRNCEAAALEGLDWRHHKEDFTDHNA
jgi:lysozyme